MPQLHDMTDQEMVVPPPVRTPYGWHNELVHVATGEVVQEVFDSATKLEGLDELPGYE
ncbi:hypothetical protein AMB3_3660 [plant metagenome]|uniref:Uncharacterized protein n=1 Tax=plant metagenome TaxID=1297885 RepID=A0A484P2P4_9ZZZZ